MLPDRRTRCLPGDAPGVDAARVRVITARGGPLMLGPGSRLEEWRIERRVGEGGMGEVYAATHDVIGKRAAIKVIRADRCASPGAADRFVQEARIVNQIGHPGIVDIFHIGTLVDGRPYLVMELLDGRTLGERLDDGRVPPLEAIAILLQICAALAAAHDHGVLHRDLKPDNIFLLGAGDDLRVKLVDWGIAKIKDALPSAETAAGMVFGTPRYLSPEQARNHGVDERSDIYSLGAIAYELFLEAPPFTADNAADVIAQHLCEPVPPPSDVWPDVPPALEILLLDMLAKSPADRPALDDVAARLRAIGDDLAARAGRPSPRRFVAATPPACPPLPAVAEPLPLAATELAEPEVDARAVRLGGAAAGVAAMAAAITLLAGARACADPGALDHALGPPIASTLAAEDAARSAREALAEAHRAAPPLGTLDLRVRPATARIVVDGVEVVAVDGRAVAQVAPGLHEIVVEAPGQAPYRREIVIEARPLLVDIDLGPAPAPRPAPPRRRTARPRIHPDATIDPF